jgi:hypothetical protein
MSTVGPKQVDIPIVSPAGQHQRAMDEDLAPVVQRGSFRGNTDARRQVLAQTQPVGKITKGVETHVANDLVTSGFHNDGDGAGSFHLVGALLVLVSVDLAIVRIPDGKGTYADTRLQGQVAA